MMGTTEDWWKLQKKKLVVLQVKWLTAAYHQYRAKAVLEKDIRLGKTKWIKIKVKGQQRFLIFSRNNFQKKKTLNLISVYNHNLKAFPT